MKKISILLALGATIPFLLISLYAIFTYGNFTGSIGMGGMEIVLMLVAAFYFSVVCLILFVIRIVYLKSKGLPVKQEIIYFVATLLIFSALSLLAWDLGNYCFKSKCKFIPEHNF